MPENNADVQKEILHIMSEWRKGQVDKHRGIFNFGERAQFRFDAIREAGVTRQVPLDGWQIRRFNHTGIGQYDYIEDWTTIDQGEVWGEGKIGAFFKREVKVPDDWAGEKVLLRMHLGGDALLRVDGMPYSALDPFHYEVLLTENAKGGETYQIEVESSLNYHLPTGPPRRVVLAELAAVDQPMRDAYWDLWAVGKMLQVPDIDQVVADFLEHNLWEAMKLVPLRETDHARFRSCVLAAQKQVRQTVYASDRFKGEGLMHLIGHSHLDVVYQWPYREYVRKVGRTHSTMLRLLEQYPHFRFCQSQAKTYADMKQHFPELFEQVKQRVKEGRWEIVGAFWVEPDCNLVSGESFTRQAIYGQRFFEREFGLRANTCWQPDVFGLSWALPQIMKRSGIDYFVTNKMVVWADTNPWNEHAFWWEGPDGSRVFSVVPPGHFIGTVEPKMLDTQWRRCSIRKDVGEMMHVYGWGDGGGGPDEEMLECGKRYADFPGLPGIQFSNAEDAIESIEKAAEATALPILRDEIYLEAHRGTYTSKGRMKKFNRREELMLRDIELLASLGGGDYPADELDAVWMMLLTTQFHDSLPGTHIPDVWPDLLDEHAEIQQRSQTMLDQALGDVCSKVAPHPGESIVVVNTALHRRDDVISLDPGSLGGKVVCDANGDPLLQQAVADLDGTKRTIASLPEGVPGVGWAALQLGEGDIPAVESLSVSESVLENQYIRAEFDDAGQLTRLYDKHHDREALVPGEVGNKLQMYEDTPGRYDAWDIVATYQDHPIAVDSPCEITIDESGPFRASLLVSRPWASSHIRQRISLYANSPILYFETEVDWKERQRLLKVGFPIDVNTDHATYDIAYGNMERSNQRFHPIDRARFEVPAHWWMDLSQTDYGVSLLNDCKYGHEANGKWMRLTLLKGPIHPDPQSDIEVHHFTYAIYPHAGTWVDAQTMEIATGMNVPLLARRVNGKPAAAEGQFVTGGELGLGLEAIKQSEDGRHTIVRLTEQLNRTVRTSLKFDRPVQQAWSCNLMEDNEADLTCEGNAVNLTIGPREIMTVRVAF
jgi:alpha-mannosidase